MKRLYLIRHAEAEMQAPGDQDHARRLTPLGRQDARETGKCLARTAGQPRRILASSAARARETAAAIAEEAGLSPDQIFVEDALYLAETDTFLNVLRRLPDAVEAVFVVGHNPGITHLANVLGNREAPGMRPAGFVSLNLDIVSWSDLAEGTGDTV